MTDLHIELADLVHELVDSFEHSEPYAVLRLRSAVPDGRPAQEIRVHKTHQPSLLDQLALAVEPSVDADAMRHGVAGSRPSAHLDSIDRLMEIGRECRDILDENGCKRRLTTEANIRSLVALASNLEDEPVKALIATVRRWLIWAKTVSGWDSPPKRPNCRCLVCNELGSLRARFLPTTICCIRCGATWDESNLGLLAAAMSAQDQPAQAKS